MTVMMGSPSSNAAATIVDRLSGVIGELTSARAAFSVDENNFLAGRDAAGTAAASLSAAALALRVAQPAFEVIGATLAADAARIIDSHQWTTVAHGGSAPAVVAHTFFPSPMKAAIATAIADATEAVRLINGAS